MTGEATDQENASMPEATGGDDLPERTDPTAVTAALAAEFERQRPRLRSIAFRMLGSHNDADDAVQEAWLRLQRNDPSEVDNLAGWLTVVVSRVCLDLLRSKTSHREQLFADPDDVGGTHDPDHDPAVETAPAGARTPEDHTVEADAV